MKVLIYITIALVAFATMLFELLQTRILSFVFWNDVVYLTVSMALLGFGISGSLVALFASKISNYELWVSRLLWLFGACMIFALIGTSNINLFWLLAVPPLKLLSNDQVMVVQLFFCYGVYLPGFIVSGALISIMLSNPAYKVTKLYAVDLMAAGSACAMFFLLLPAFGPEKLVGLLSTAVALLGFYIGKKIGKPATPAIAVVILGMVIMFSDMVKIIPEPYKDMAIRAYAMNVKPEKTVWNPLCRIDILGDDKHDLDYFPGMYPPHSYKVIYQDGSALTRLLSRSSILDTLNRAKQKNFFADGEIFYFIKHQPKVMIIGLGGRTDVAFALAFDAKKIYGAEINSATYKLPMEFYRDYTGPFFEDPRVSLVNSEGRSALRSLPELMDVIVLNGIDTFAALNAGAYVLSENYLYTVEAFDEMFSHLNQDGILAFNRWNTQPPRESLRLASLGCESLKRSGCQTINQQIFICGFPCGDHSRLFGSNEDRVAAHGWAACIFKKTPFTESETRTLIDAASQQKLKILYCPKVFEPSVQQEFESTYIKNNSFDENFAPNSKCFNDLIAAYTKGEQKKFFASYPYEITPSTDDSPFFFEYPLKNKFGLPKLSELRQTTAGFAICVVIVESLGFSLLAIFLPLWKYRREGIRVKYTPQLSLYFSAVGIGFMLIEMGLVQKFVLFLGGPLYALSVVLASLLLSAGLGSAAVSRLNWSWLKVITVFGSSLVMLLLVVIFGINTLFYSLLHLSWLLRILIAFLVVLPIGFFMGTFFPTALEVVKKYNPSYVPWAWGINGCTSVFGSIAAIALAMSQGFTFSLLVGVFCYLVACLSVYSMASLAK